MKTILRFIPFFLLLVPAALAARDVLDDLLPPTTAPAQQPDSTRFDLDFAGGTPAQLVAAIDRATGKRLNAIIPPKHAAEQLPPLRMSGVTVPQLLAALSASNRSLIAIRQGPGGTGPVQFLRREAGFRTEEKRPTGESIWFFEVDNPEFELDEPRLCRFYLLTPYLESGLKVADITTAIQTGWRMMDDADGAPASLSYHEESQLLIVVGNRLHLDTLERALAALGGRRGTRPLPSPPPPGTDSGKPES